MPNYLVSWIESRVHYVEVEAEDKFDALELANEFDYADTASDSISYNGHRATLIEAESYFRIRD